MYDYTLPLEKINVNFKYKFFSRPCKKKINCFSSMVEHNSVIVGVVGSIPAGASCKLSFTFYVFYLEGTFIGLY